MKVDHNLIYLAYVHTEVVFTLAHGTSGWLSYALSPFKSLDRSSTLSLTSPLLSYVFILIVVVAVFVR